MAKIIDGKVVSDNGSWEYQAGSLRPWKHVDAGDDSPKPGVKETFQAAELARQQRIEKRKA